MCVLTLWKQLFSSKIGCKNRGYSQKNFLFFGLTTYFWGYFAEQQSIVDKKTTQKLHKNGI